MLIMSSRFYCMLYNNPSYSRILIGSCLWSIRGQMHDWCHHYKVFPSAVLKWRKVLRIRIIFYLTGQKIRYKKVLPSHWTAFFVFCYYIKQIDSMLPCVWFSNRSQKTSKCGKNISDTLGYASYATFSFLPHFDVICDLLLNRRMVTWNLFVK